MTMRRVFFYVQHLLGIGHLIRASRVARALNEGGFEVAMAVGGAPFEGFPGPGIGVIDLPPIKAAAGFAGLERADGSPVDESFKIRRRDRLLAAVGESRPDVLLIEAFPFGRRQMRFELLPLLELAAGLRPRPLIACSVRDILQENRKAGRAEETVDLVRNYFDLVLVHGDPAFIELEETFPLARQFGDRIAYTGMVAGPPPRQPKEQFDIIVSTGGGAAGTDLVRTTAEAAHALAASVRLCLITGPNLPSADFEALTRKATGGLRIYRFRSDFADLLRGARLSVSQAGYNTVCDILQAGCPAVLVPFAAGGENEQTVRASRLEALGLATLLREDDLNPESLKEAIAAGLTAAKPAAHGLDLKGAEGTREILRQRLTKA